ncbi:MAG: protein-tyrosine-phosphatase [Verrucomicrobiota bacterium]
MDILKKAWVGSLENRIAEIVELVGKVTVERKEFLDTAAERIAKELSAQEEAKLNFICTHNSRRSHLAHVWATVAAHAYGLVHLSAYSGGTEATACNERTVSSLKRSGFEISKKGEGENPHYLCKYSTSAPAIDLFSKVYDQEGNPESRYFAMMCCSDVDEACPIIHGAHARIPLHYQDPKSSDGTPEEAATYDQRSEQIGAEMFYLMRQVASK